MSKCEHKRRWIEFRDQFPAEGEEFDPKANGVWQVCQDCGEEWQSDFHKNLSEVERIINEAVRKEIFDEE